MRPHLPRSPRPASPLRRAWGALLAATLGQAVAAEPRAPEAPELPPAASASAPGGAPALHVVGFADRAGEGDCDLVAAQYGRCVETVDFLDLSGAWREGEQPDAATRHTWRALGDLYASLWEDLATRWPVKEDPISETLRAAGVVALNAPAQQWEASARGQKRTFALPDPSLWLTVSDWREPPGVATPLSGDEESGVFDPSRPYFRMLRYHLPSGAPRPADIAVLRGRFATRLAFNGRRHTYDIMDGDPDSSGPFFEQMYPYDTALQSSDQSLLPLRHFIAPEQLKVPGLAPDGERARELRAQAYAAVAFEPSAGMAEARGLATEEFQRFFHLIGTQIVRFALEETSPTHLRVLTTLIAMNTPPGRLDDGAMARNVVAASEGETDSDGLVQSLVQPGFLSAGRAFRLNYSQLPMKIVDDYLSRFPEWAAPPDELLDALNREIAAVLPELLRPGTRPIAALGATGLAEWVEASALPGRASDVEGHVKRLGLSLLVARLPAELRDEVETRLLLDHVEVAISSRFDTTPGYFATPNGQEAQTAVQWKTTLGRHGFHPAPIPDGPGAVDPIAICTTRDRQAALNEPSFGAINLDVLAVAADGLTTADEVLWAARDDLPVMMLDDPTATVPSVARLVGLPDSKAIYRVRWSLWSTWHLLWDVEPVAEPGGPERLVLRTGAICADTVLASPDLIATLARASLLEGELRHTAPVRGLSKKERKRIEEEERRRRGRAEARGPSNDEAVAGVKAAGALAGQAKLGAERSVDVAADDPGRTDEVASANASRLGGLVNRREQGHDDHITEVTDPASYIRDLMLRPLEDLAALEQATLLFAFDVRGDQGSPWRLRPRSPYAIEAVGFGPSRAVTAAWVQEIQSGDKGGSATFLAPLWRPTESVSAGSPTPRWGRRASADYTLDGGLGLFPLRQTTFRCADDALGDEATDLSTVAPCDPEAAAALASSDGAAVDLSSLLTLWLVDEPRIALEFGPKLQILAMPSGHGRLWPLDEPRYAWTWSPRFGLSAGLRFAPDPGPLVRAGAGTPWGADGPDGRSRLGRLQWGLRASFLLGAGYNGLEGTAGSELWAGWSIRRARGPGASFTPYRPAAVIGPFAAAQLGFTLLQGDEPRYYELLRRGEVIVGLRGQLRLSATAGKPPEVK